MPYPEMVVLLDDAGGPVGTMPKEQVHTDRTPLHLAFSCLVLDDAGAMLLTRRALGKRTWPGVWTGACCGHPEPDEAVESAVHRRVRYELGCDVTDLRCIDPHFRYRATSAEGIVENEVCPVYVARLAGDLSPRTDEVADVGWLPATDVVRLAESAPFLVSPWLVLQLSRDTVRRVVL